MAQGLVKIKVTSQGLYCVRYFSALMQPLPAPYIQDQCYVTVLDAGNHYINLALHSGTYVVPKIRIYKGFVGSLDFRDVNNVQIDCVAPSTSSTPPTTSTPPSTSVPPSTSTSSSLPYCGCSGPNTFSILSVTSEGGGNYKVVYNACNVNPISWQVRNSSNTTVASGSIVPESAEVIVPVGSQPAGTYTIIFSSPNCVGTATLDFIISAGGGGGGSTTSSTPPSTSTSSTPPGFQGIVVDDYQIGGTTGNRVDLTLSGGTNGVSTEILLKVAGTTVGSLTAPYSSSMSVNSSVYGYVDIFINGADKGTAYLQQRLYGAYTVEEAKGVDENDYFMKLTYTQNADGTFTIADTGSKPFNTKYYNVNGRWRNNISGLKLEPNITHSITKFGYNGTYWGDGSQEQNKKQITFKIKPA